MVIGVTGQSIKVSKHSGNNPNYSTNNSNALKGKSKVAKQNHTQDADRRFRRTNHGLNASMDLIRFNTKSSKLYTINHQVTNQSFTNQKNTFPHNTNYSMDNHEYFNK